jgi:hypothetical protein
MSGVDIKAEQHFTGEIGQALPEVKHPNRFRRCAAEP